MWNPVVIETVLWGYSFELQFFGLVALIVASFIFPPYIQSMVRGEQTPPRSTWFLYLLMDGTTFATRLSDGAFDAMLFAYTVGTLFIALFTLRFGTRGWEPLDTYCSAIVAVAIVLLVAGMPPWLATVVSLGAIGVATIPLFKRVRKGEYEDRRAWTVALCSSFFNLLDGQWITSPWFMLIQATIISYVLSHWGLTRKPTKEAAASA